MNKTHPPRLPGPGPDLRHYTDGHATRDWMAAAACRNHDPELWFADNRHNPHARHDTRYATRAAQRICHECCPVIKECLIYALTTDTRFGIWGGATAHDRARLTGRKTCG